MIPRPLFFKIWIGIVGRRQMLALAILTAVYLLLYGKHDIARVVFKALHRIVLKTLGYLVDYVMYALNIHTDRLRGGDLHHRPMLSLLCFLNTHDDVMHCPEHLAPGGLLSVLPKDIQVLGDELFSCQSFGRLLEECHVLILYHIGYTSSIPSIPASSSVLGALSLGASVELPDTVRVRVFFSAL